MTTRSFDSQTIPVETILRPIHEATGLPNQAYVDPDFTRYERDQVLGKNWSGIGFVSDLPLPGYVKPVEFLGLPLLITRSKQDEIQVFHNVCSHRGRILVAQEGEVGGLLRCPYHSWTYDLSGNLRGTPHIGGVDVHTVSGFDCAAHGLKPVRSHVWMDVIFINLSGDAEDFESYASPITERWKPYIGERGLDEMRRPEQHSTMTLEVDCNWKLAVENYCEAYHLPFIHPDLNRYSRLEDHYHIMVEDRFAGQGSSTYNLAGDAGVYLPRFSNWPDDRSMEAEYIAFYPNVLLGLAADQVFVIILEPKSESKTVEHLRLYYAGDTALEAKYEGCRVSVLESWRVVFGEDVDAVESMQKGRSSPGYGGGVFSPVMDNPTHHFHSWVAQQLKLAG